MANIDRSISLSNGLVTGGRIKVDVELLKRFVTLLSPHEAGSLLASLRAWGGVVDFERN